MKYILLIFRLPVSLLCLLPRFVDYGLRVIFEYLCTRFGPLDCDSEVLLMVFGFFCLCWKVAVISPTFGIDLNCNYDGDDIDEYDKVLMVVMMALNYGCLWFK